MKTLKLIIPFSCISGYLIGAAPVVAPFINFRSQGQNDALQCAGMTRATHQPLSIFYGTLVITPEYTSSFKLDHVTKVLFGEDLVTDSCNTINISGSRVANRGTKDWLADYFGLPTNFQSSITFDPHISNILIDFDWYLGLNDWHKGLYFTMHTPLVHTRWDLNLKETIAQTGTNGYDAGYVAPAAVERKHLLHSFTEYAAGTSIVNVPDLTFQGLNNARMSSERKLLTRLADIHISLGWDFYQRPHAHLGFAGCIVAPGGNRPEGKFLFEPMVGNNHHWEIGAQITGHKTFWYNISETKSCGVYGSLYASHFLKSLQYRTFDLRNKPLSRYMLAQRLGTPIDLNLKGNGITPSAQYKLELAPVANLTTINVSSSIGIQADMVLMFNYTYNRCSFDIGYNLWTRSCETLSRRGLSELDDGIRWTLKGDAHIFGFASADDAVAPTLTQNDPVALSATEKNATIHQGTNFSDTTLTLAQQRRNPNIDNTQAATAGGSNTPLVATIGGATPADNINTSIQPHFITLDQLELCPAFTGGLSQKIFGNFCYTWDHRTNATPYLGIGAEAEFGMNNHNDICITTEHNCITCSLSQWGIWLKGGISF